MSPSDGVAPGGTDATGQGSTATAQGSGATTGRSSATTGGSGAGPQPPADGAPTGMGNNNTGGMSQEMLFQAFMAFMGRAAPSLQPPPAPAPVNAAAFPQFTFMAPLQNSAGTSLLDLFPAIEGSVLLEIAQHSFKPGDLAKLDPRCKDRTQRQILDVSGGIVSVRDHAPRDYPSFQSLYIPLSTYFDVLAGFAATGSSTEALYQVTSSTSTYLARLVQFSQDYQWSAVVAYHFDFHYKRRRDMVRGDYSGWATIDTALQAEHLIGRERSRGSAHPNKPASGGPGKARDSDVCRNFNKGNCASPCQHNRAHKCSGCGSADHGQSACPRA